MKKIVGIYHICPINHWKQVVEEMINDIKMSGLYDAMTTLYCSVIGEYDEYDILDNDPKIVVINEYTDPKEYEFPSLKLLWEHCKKEDSYVFYIHTKGVSYDINSKSVNWRRAMCEKILIDWKTRISELENGALTTGYNLKVKYKLHYAGNFWWANSKYVRLLKEPYKEKPISWKGRREAEMWIVGSHLI